MGPTLARLPVTKPVFIHNVLRKTEISMNVIPLLIFCEFTKNLLDNHLPFKFFLSDLSIYPLQRL